MKKMILLITVLFTLVSCSGNITRPTERFPASFSSCADGIKDFFGSGRQVSAGGVKVKELVSKHVLNEEDLSFLKEKEITMFLSKQKVEKEEVEADILLIKKKYQHMEPSQVISHFKLLRNFCGQDI